MACHPTATCHIAGCNNSICRIENRFSPYFIFCCFFSAVWPLTSGEFRIVSDILFKKRNEADWLAGWYIVRLTEWMRDTNHEPVWVDVVHAEVLHVAGETFVEPQVVPPRHRHQIPEPLQQTVYTQFPPLVPVMFSRPTRFPCRVTAVQTV